MSSLGDGDGDGAEALRLLLGGGAAPARGPGSAEMTYGEEPGIDPSLFAAEQLPPSRIADEASSALLGVDRVAPEVDAHGESAGTQGVQDARGAVTWKRRLSPDQRAAVRRFFSPPE